MSKHLNYPLKKQINERKPSTGYNNNKGGQIGGFATDYVRM